MDQNTTVFSPQKEESKRVKEIMEQVVAALKDKGYEPISQIIGYILSGDPTYITSHNNARALICKIERDELLEEILSDLIKEGYSGQKLQKELKNRRAKVKPAVKKMLDDAHKMATGELESMSYDDVFGEED